MSTINDGVNVLTGSGAPAPEPSLDDWIADHTVDEVLDAVESGRFDRDEVVESERAGKARTTILSALADPNDDD